MKRQRRFQSALRKFQRFHRIAADRNLELRWCYKGRPGTFLEHVCPAVGCPGRNSRRPGLGWWRRSIGERRSWLFPLYYTTDQGWWMLPGVQAHRQEMFCCNPTWHVGNWSHQHTDWGVGTSGWELGFVDVNDLVSCNVYAQPLSLWLFWRLIDQRAFQPLVNKRGKAVVPAQVWPSQWEVRKLNAKDGSFINCLRVQECSRVAILLLQTLVKWQVKI